MAEESWPPWAASAFRRALRQPDQRSCGAAVLVVARVLTDPAHAPDAATADAFRSAVLAMHRRVTSPKDPRGGLQLPWPRTFGTPPWAVAHQLEATTGLDHDRRLLLRRRRKAAYDKIRAATAERQVVPLFVGSRWLPRHVVLVLGEVEDDVLRIYEPACGRLVDVTREAFVSATLDLGGWRKPWFSVLPRGRRTPA